MRGLPNLTKSAPDRPLSLRGYLWATSLIPLIAARHLKRRLARGKEHPDRWREKLGQPSDTRPKGRLIWINAVGLGEILSLRGLIKALTDADADLTVLVTSTTRQSAEIFAKHQPERTIHQFLPLDCAKYRRAFLDHWTPDAVIWAEQEVWPGFVEDIAQAGIPQAMIAARMGRRSFRSHQRATAMFRTLYSRMEFITAQDGESADHLTRLGAKDVTVTGSLKPTAPPLACDLDELQHLQTTLNGRFIWAATSTYPEDDALVLEAHRTLRTHLPDALLILAPRHIQRSVEGTNDAPRRALGQHPGAKDPVWLFDTIGDLGLAYRVSQAAFIGGTLGDVEGHSPWEATILNTPVLHGPRVANFADDYAALETAGATRKVTTAQDIAEVLQSADLTSRAQASATLIAKAQARLKSLAADIQHMIKPSHDS